MKTAKFKKKKKGHKNFFVLALGGLTIVEKQLMLKMGDENSCVE